MDLNESFKSTCRILLGKEVGELGEFQAFLSRYAQKVNSGNSSLGGKPTYFSENYPKNRLISYPEAACIMAKPFGINQLKDIDSLLGAATERFLYAGDKILGKSASVERSDNVIDSVYVKDSREIYESEFVANCQMVDGCKHMSGCSWGTLSSFCMNATEFFKSTRVFESGLIINSGDIFFSYNCNNCSNLLFCFNQRSKRYAIGNCQLEQAKFAQLKAKLVAEAADYMQKYKTFPSVVELSQGCYKNG